MPHPAAPYPLHRRPIERSGFKLLYISERALSLAQLANERAITHLRLRVRAWQLALDPDTRPWIAAARKSLANGTAHKEAMGSEEIARRLDEARRDLPA